MRMGLAGAVAALALALPATAWSQDAIAADTVDAVAHAALVAGQPSATGPPGQVQDTAGGVLVEAPSDLSSDVRMVLPGSDLVSRSEDGVVASATGDSTVVLQATEVGGVRASIAIDSPEAPERYEFRFAGASRLALNADGSVTIYDAAGQADSGVDAPWARDGEGKSVATHYEINGTTLIQVVEHRQPDVAYGVVADPFWFGLAVKACMKVKCYNWLPSYVRRQFLYGPQNSAVTAWLKAWFCGSTWIC